MLRALVQQRVMGWRISDNHDYLKKNKKAGDQSDLVPQRHAKVSCPLAIDLPAYK